jgi:hypothetical protein
MAIFKIVAWMSFFPNVAASAVRKVYAKNAGHGYERAAGEDAFHRGSHCL